MLAHIATLVRDNPDLSFMTGVMLGLMGGYSVGFLTGSQRGFKRGVRHMGSLLADPDDDEEAHGSVTVVPLSFARRSLDIRRQRETLDRAWGGR